MNEELDSQLSAMFDDELPAAECELLARRLSRDERAQGALGPVCGHRRDHPRRAWRAPERRAGAPRQCRLSAEPALRPVRAAVPRAPSGPALVAAARRRCGSRPASPRSRFSGCAPRRSLGAGCPGRRPPWPRHGRPGAAAGGRGAASTADSYVRRSAVAARRRSSRARSWPTTSSPTASSPRPSTRAICSRLSWRVSREPPAPPTGSEEPTEDVQGRCERIRSSERFWLACCWPWPWRVGARR